MLEESIKKTKQFVLIAAFVVVVMPMRAATNADDVSKAIHLLGEGVTILSQQVQEYAGLAGDLENAMITHESEMSPEFKADVLAVINKRGPKLDALATRFNAYARKANNAAK